MIKSQAIKYKDFSSDWYKTWSVLLKQEDGLTPNQKIHNKAWQNAIILQALHERGYLQPGNQALGFGVGTERVPSALASLELKVTATDQDFISGEKGGWNNGQLTRTRTDLNRYRIARRQQFDTNVAFENCDMTKIPRKFANKYNIIWSNCALGHLGSIDAGIKFIEKSLECLKPGGIAIHTTETNVVSNSDTIESGGTVIFRRKDLVGLFFRLRSMGYECEPLYLNFGSAPQDKQFSFDPYNTEDLLKLNAGGYLLSQMVLVITKPTAMRPDRMAYLKKKLEEGLNSYRMAAYIRSNPELQEYIAQPQQLIVSGVKGRKLTEITCKSKEQVTVKLKFKNISPKSYYGINTMFHDTSPLMIATTQPINRDSKLFTKKWLSPSRPHPDYLQRNEPIKWGGIKPGSTFYAVFELKAPAKPGKYTETFCFTLEGFPPIPDSEFGVTLNVKK